MIRALRLHHWGPILGLIGGVALGAVILRDVGLNQVLLLMKQGMAGIAVVIGFHGTQILAAGAAWWAVSRTLSNVPSYSTFAFLRWLREGMNTLLPVAQIAGLAISIRLLCRAGQTPAAATASAIVDTSVELVTQIAFTLFGLGILAMIKGADAVAPEALSGLLFISAAAVSLIAALSLGGARLAERAAARMGLQGAVEGLHEAIMAIYRNHRALGSAICCHLFAWLLGGVEVALVFHFFGRDIGIAQGLVIDSLGQAIRTAGFAVPAAIGVQEGGYMLVCGFLGIGPDLAVALSLIKRVRDIAYGVPCIALWLWLEGKHAKREGAAMSESPAPPLTRRSR